MKNYLEKSRDHRRESGDSSEDWQGRWMPERPSDPTPPPKVFHKSEIQKQNMGSNTMDRIPMGVKSVDCDDGKVYINFKFLNISFQPSPNK